MSKPVHPVGVFDSGLGGLTVLHALRGQLPAEDFFYFADTHHLPYGDKPEIFLRQRGVVIAKAMVARGIKALVVACNTATAAAVEAIRQAVHVPVVAVEPGVKPAAGLSHSGQVGVMATTRTVDSLRFRRLLDQHAQQVNVQAQACSGLAEAIELYGPESPQVAQLLDRFLAPWRENGTDVVVLGCTHYPWVKRQIQARLPDAKIVDTGEAVARQLHRCLLSCGGLGGGSGQVQLATSGDPLKVRLTVDRLWSLNFQPGDHGMSFPLLSIEHWNPS